MLKEAIEKIVSLAAPTIREIEGSVFRITQDGDVSEIHPKPVYPSTLKLNSLDALVKMIRTEGAIHGGMWKLKARETVKAYFEKRLSDEISNGSVVVAL